MNLTRILLGQDTIGIAEVAVIRRQIAEKDSLARPASSRAQGSILIQSHYSTWKGLMRKGAKPLGQAARPSIIDELYEGQGSRSKTLAPATTWR